MLAWLREQALPLLKACNSRIRQSWQAWRPGGFLASELAGQDASVVKGASPGPIESLLFLLKNIYPPGPVGRYRPLYRPPLSVPL